MRFTFVILLFLSLGSDAQMIIKAHPNYVPFASANLLLDQYSGAAAAYSLRKLRTAYTGSAIRVRRSNDNSEQDIGFTSSGDLDTAALKTFVGAGNNGFVTVWYDQSGNAMNATQTTAANQPRVVNAGVVDRIAGEPTIRFDGSNDLLSANDLSSTTSGADKPFSVFTITNKFNTNTDGCIFTSANSANISQQIQFITLTNAAKYRFLFKDNTQAAANFESTTSYLSNTNYLITSITTGTTPNIFSNGGSNLLTGTYDQETATFDRVTIGALLRQTTVAYFGGFISELIFYPSDQSSNRTGIENNINTYFSIY